MQKKLCLVVLSSFFALKTHAIQEFETVVKDIQFNSSSRIVIDKEEIEKSRAKSLTSLLAAQANISITQSNFTPSSIFLRGGDSSHVLILIDGVPFYDASTIQRTINLNSLDIKSVQKIEVVKGSQSVLFGGQALAGVIKIETVPKNLKTSAYVMGTAGSYQQLNVAGGINKNVEDQSAVIARASYSQKEASSPILGSSKTYPTNLGTGEVGYIDRNHPVNYLLKAQTLFDKTMIPSTGQMTGAAEDADGFGASTYQLNYTGHFSVPDSYFKPVFSVSNQQSARLFEQNFQDSGGSPTKWEYNGEMLALRYEMTALDLQQVFNLKLGASFIKEKMIFKISNQVQTDSISEFEGFFAKAQTQIVPFFVFEAGARADFNQMKNQFNTHQVGVTAFENLKIEYSTGLKQPSLFQLFSSYGNSNLRPEKSESVSAEIDHRFSDNLFGSYTYFENRFTDLIIAQGAPPNTRYENVNGSETKGHELALTYRDLSHGTTYNLNVGYQEPVDKGQKNWLLRRPLRTASLRVRQDFENLGLGTELIHNGDRRDLFGTSYGTLSSYTILNLIADYKFNERLTGFARLQNVGNQRYESTYSFHDEGINAQVGAQMDF